MSGTEGQRSTPHSSFCALSQAPPDFQTRARAAGARAGPFLRPPSVLLLQVSNSESGLGNWPTESPEVRPPGGSSQAPGASPPRPAHPARQPAPGPHPWPAWASGSPPAGPIPPGARSARPWHLGGGASAAGAAQGHSRSFPAPGRAEPDATAGIHPLGHPLTFQVPSPTMGILVPLQSTM